MTSPLFNLMSGSPDERFDEFERFVEHWLGSRKEGYGASAVELATVDLPTPLRRFYAFLGNWPGSPMCKQNKLHPVDTLADQIGASEGLVEFAVENQGVYRWATLSEGEDPPVYCAEHWEALPDDTPLGDCPAPGWDLWDNSLTNFLITYAITELALTSTPATAINWSSSLERYTQSDEANVVVLQADNNGNPSSILVDGDYLFDNRKHFRWHFCAARTAEAADALARFNGELEKLDIYIGKALSSGTPTQRDWFLEVWATGAARVRHYPMDEWLPPNTVDVDALVNELTKENTDGIKTTIKKIGAADTNASMPIKHAIKLFDLLVNSAPARRTSHKAVKTYVIKAFAAKHPPAITGRESKEIDASAPPLAKSIRTTEAKAAIATQTDRQVAIAITLDDWELTVLANGSGAIIWKQFGSAFDKNTFNASELSTELRRAAIKEEKPPLGIPKLSENASDVLQVIPNNEVAAALKKAYELQQIALRNHVQKAVRINDSKPNELAVEPSVVETIWNRALQACGTLPVAMQQAQKNSPPNFAIAAGIKH